MHLQGSIVVSWFHYPPCDMCDSMLSTTVFTLSIRKTAPTFGPVFYASRTLKVA